MKNHFRRVLCALLALALCLPLNAMADVSITIIGEDGEQEVLQAAETEDQGLSLIHIFTVLSPLPPRIIMWRSSMRYVPYRSAMACMLPSCPVRWQTKRATACM